MRSERGEKRPSGSLTETARRAQLVDAAIGVLAERGFAATSLGAIASRVGISKGVISYHFAGKTELLHEVVRTVLRRATEWMTPRIQGASSHTEALRSYVLANISYLDANRDEVLALTEVLANARATPGAEDIFRASNEEAVEALASIFRAGAAAGEFAAIPERTAAIALRAAIDATTPALRADEEFPLEDFGAELAQLWERLVAR